MQEDEGERRYHIVITAQGSATHWQARVHYYWYKKVRLRQCLQSHLSSEQDAEQRSPYQAQGTLPSHSESQIIWVKQDSPTGFSYCTHERAAVMLTSRMRQAFTHTADLMMSQYTRA